MLTNHNEGLYRSVDSWPTFDEIVNSEHIREAILFRKNVMTEIMTTRTDEKIRGVCNERGVVF